MQQCETKPVEVIGFLTTAIGKLYGDSHDFGCEETRVSLDGGLCFFSAGNKEEDNKEKACRFHGL
jgi:hypothetical protein